MKIRMTDYLPNLKNLRLIKILVLRNISRYFFLKRRERSIIDPSSLVIVYVNDGIFDISA